MSGNAPPPPAVGSGRRQSRAGGHDEDHGTADLVQRQPAIDADPSPRRARPVLLAELVPFAVADELAQGVARAALALVERLVVLELERFATTTSPDRAIAGVRRLAARLAELADALDGAEDLAVAS